MGENILTIKDLVVNYGNIQALAGISIDIQHGEIVTLIGSNGAGKSTTLRTVSGINKPTSGDISFEGKSIIGMKTHQLAKAGIAHAPEGRHIIPGLTVEQNLQVGLTARPAEFKDSIEEDFERMYNLFPVLRDRRKQTGWSLSGGEQQMLSLARALISKPRLLLLDEPSLGLAPKVTAQVFEAIASVNKVDGVTILLVEQNAFMALNVADRGYLLENGAIRHSGTSKELLASPAVRDAYLGA
jgi:branched-chain amino acid transport system ATP-binding protein